MTCNAEMLSGKLCLSPCCCSNPLYVDSLWIILNYWEDNISKPSATCRKWSTSAHTTEEHLWKTTFKTTQNSPTIPSHKCEKQRGEHSKSKDDISKDPAFGVFPFTKRLYTTQQRLCGAGWGDARTKKKTAKTRNKLTHIPHMYCTADTPYIRFRKKKKTTSSAALVTVGVDWCVVGVQAEFACCTWHRVRLSCSRGL